MAAERQDVERRARKPGAYFGAPLSIWVLFFLACGLAAGLLFPGNRLLSALYSSGTYFPRLVVTFAALIVFALLAGATAKLVLMHRRQARRLFGLIVVLYVALGLVSLLWVSAWIPVLVRPSLQWAGIATGGPSEPRQVAGAFSTLFSDQPLIQALAGAVIIGYLTARLSRLRAVANGLIAAGDATLWLFKKLLWYYPLMIGCLAIGIPARFGLHGMAAYGQTVLWVGTATVSLSLLLLVVVKLATKRSLRQLLSYFGAVWPTGFGTGGSYETLAMNVVSAEQDLGLRREIAEVSIVFGTVMNKSCATVSVLLVTISVARLLGIPVSIQQILLLIPPLLILGLESPGIPGGAAFFMSPIVAALLRVRDAEMFVATFVAMYSGLIPMFSTAGNTTNDGLVGALINDRFAKYLSLAEPAAAESAGEIVAGGRAFGTRGMRAFFGWILLIGGAGMLAVPQARLGLKQLQWMYSFAFPGEAALGMLVVSASLYLLAARPAHQRPN